MTESTIPKVFIIESLSAENRRDGLCEGEIISRILVMGCRNPIYRYATSRQEFVQALDEFNRSNYRYLHLSSHGASDHFLFQFGEIYFNQFGGLVRNMLFHKRVFVSACEAVNHQNHELANAILRDSGCYSLIGSAEEIPFDAAAMFWATFYYLAFEDRGPDEKITRDLVVNLLRKLTTIYPLTMNYYSPSRHEGIKLDRFTKGTKVRL